MCQIRTNITAVIQKIIFVITYSFLPFFFWFFPQTCGFTSETKLNDSFTRYPKLVLVLYTNTKFIILVL